MATSRHVLGTSVAHTMTFYQTQYCNPFKFCQKTSLVVFIAEKITEAGCRVQSKYIRLSLSPFTDKGSTSNDIIVDINMLYQCALWADPPLSLRMCFMDGTKCKSNHILYICNKCSRNLFYQKEINPKRRVF